MPAALHPKNQKLEFTTATATAKVTRSNQVKDFVFCEACEGRLNRNGETHVLGLVAAKAGRTFPLLGKFASATALRARPDLRVVYSGPDVGMDTAKFAFFALSVVWRASVHEWRIFDGTTLTPFDLGYHAEPIRRYLLGETQFPPETAVVVAVCTDALTRREWLVPTMGDADGYSTCRFQTFGLNFAVYLGPRIPNEAKDLCCYSSPEKPVLTADCEYLTRAVAATLQPTSKAGR